MRRRIAQAIAGILIRRSIAFAVAIIILVALSVWQVRNLEINNNQIDLIPQNLESVRATKQMIKLVGGVGYFLFALKGDNLNHMKAVADDLALRLGALPEVREVSYKKDIGFVRDRILLYIKTEDLEEGYRRIRRKIRSVLSENNPLGFSLKEKGKKEEIKFDDLIDKYRIVNKKGIEDNYLVDPEKKMLLLIVKPRGAPSDLAFTEKLLNKIYAIISEYNARNPHRAVLKESYRGMAPGATITYGFTGDHKRTIDDARIIRKALAPTSIISFVCIFIYLIYLLRRFSLISMVMTILTASIVMTYAFCKVTIGELNSITSVLAAILMGFGIDFGLHYLFRMRETFTRTRNLKESIIETLEYSGTASFISASTTAISLYSLLIADFKGFSHFGLMAGTGIFITMLMMYICIPVTYLVMDKFRPNFKNNLIVTYDHILSDAIAEKKYPHAKLILIGSVILTAILSFFASRITFDYDGRAVLSAETPSVMLLEEISRRYQLSSDPVGIYTKTFEETRALYKKLTPIPKNSAMDSVISLFILLPDKQQQIANRKILDDMQERLKQISPDMLDEKDRKWYFMAEKLLKARPFDFKDLPAHLVQDFLPSTKSGVKGYLTFVYPKITMWNSRVLIQFGKEVGTIDINGKKYHAAGLAVLFADLARIILDDARLFMGLTASIIALILIVAFRSFKSLFYALLPLCAGMVWMLGIMNLSGKQINFINIVVFPVVFGYGISNGVQIYYRYLHTKSVMIAIRRTGGGVIGSAITTLIGWGALLFSGHAGLFSMGLFALIGVASSTVVAFTILPALVQFTVDLKKTKRPRTKSGNK